MSFTTRYFRRIYSGTTKPLRVIHAQGSNPDATIRNHRSICSATADPNIPLWHTSCFFGTFEHCIFINTFEPSQFASLWSQYKSRISTHFCAILSSCDLALLCRFIKSCNGSILCNTSESFYLSRKGATFLCSEQPLIFQSVLPSTIFYLVSVHCHGCSNLFELAR